MGIVVTIIIGFVIGIVAKFFMPGRDPSGFILTTLLGIGGAVLATYIGQALGWYVAGQPAGFIASVIGAMLLLFIYHALSRRAI
ncbi:MAG: GlsB/YeaQ/YmgE family stress response rane protein [Bacteriovoracaceae bacterium]|nr:GlsB/YeaQ/YmgE family stress response rane protein [Bacteriovoracaceae bacterium]